MIILNMGDMEVQLINDQAFIYDNGSSEVLNIQGIESNPNAQEVIEQELELLGRESFSNIKAMEL
jgi:hypothetical protein